MASTSSVDGLISGLSTSDLITKLMSIERQPQAQLSRKITRAAATSALYQTLNSRVLAVKDAASGLTASNGLQATKATTSDADSVAVSASSTALTGSVSFNVDRLATAHTLVSSGTVASTTAPIFTVGRPSATGDVSALGIASITPGTGVASGRYAISVTQASAGASQTGAVRAPSITVGSGATLSVALDGSTTTTNTFALAAGTYTPVQLADMVKTASGGLLDTSITAGGALQLSTTREGSAASLAITGGTNGGDTATGFVPSAVASGADAVVSVNGVITQVSDLRPGATVSLVVPGGASMVSAMARGLRVGTASVNVVNNGDGSLGDYIKGINSADLGVTASAVQVGANAYRLQLQATQTGAAGAITLDTSALTAALGPMSTLITAQDARLTVGAGSSASYTIDSAKNTFEIMPGVTASLLKSDPSKTVSIGVANDSAAVAAKVQTLVAAVNNAFSYIADRSKYDGVSKSAGGLLGDSTTRAVEAALYSAITRTGQDLSSVGLGIARDGKVTFDATAFAAAYAKSPSTIATFFRDGTAASPTSRGLGNRVLQAATSSTDSVDGLITTAIKSGDSLTKTWTDQIAQMEVRMSQRQINLKKQFSGMETALSNLKNQSTWLAGQLSALDKR